VIVQVIAAITVSWHRKQHRHPGGAVTGRPGELIRPAELLPRKFLSMLLIIWIALKTGYGKISIILQNPEHG
jgi:hypothetical protein